MRAYKFVKFKKVVDKNRKIHVGIFKYNGL